MPHSHVEEQTEVTTEGQPMGGDRGASILGPHTIPLESENPDLLVSPCISGPARMTVFAPGGKARTFNYRRETSAMRFIRAAPALGRSKTLSKAQTAKLATRATVEEGFAPVSAVRPRQYGS